MVFFITFDLITHCYLINSTLLVKVYYLPQEVFTLSSHQTIKQLSSSYILLETEDNMFWY